MPAVQYYPDWFDRNAPWLPQGQLKAPQMTLIDNKIFVVQKKRTDIGSPDQIFGRGGVTAVRNTDASPAKQLNWIYNAIFNSSGAGNAGNLTNAQVDAAADSVQLCQRFVDELAEGQYGMSYSDPKYKRFWDRIKTRCAAATPPIPYRHHHIYGGFSILQGDPWQFMTGDGSQKPPNHPVFRALLQSQEAARKKPNGDLQDFYVLFYEMGMGANVKHYSDQPDYASRYYNKAYACEVQNLAFGQPRGIASDKLIYISWPEIEGLGSDSQDLHNGHYYQRVIDGQGIVGTEEHPMIDFDYHIGDILMNGFIRMGGYVLFDRAEQWGTDPAKIDSRTSFTWDPFQVGTPAPLANPGYPPQPMYLHDAGFIAAHQYNQFNRTAGEAWQPCAYRMVGSEHWVSPPPDHTWILERASDNDGAYSTTGRRGGCDAQYRVKNGAVDIALFDPSRTKLTTEKLILRPLGDGTKEFAATVRGSKPLPLNETL